MSEVNEKCLEGHGDAIILDTISLNAIIILLRYPFEIFFISHEIKNPQGERR